MVARHLVALTCFTLLFLLTTNAEFLNEDLVFEEPSTPQRWRAVNNQRTVHNSEVNSLESQSSVSDSDDGLWASAVKTILRFKRGWFDWGDDSKESTDTTPSSTTLVKDTDTTLDTSNTLQRETRSTDDDIEEFNRTTQSDYLAALNKDDEDFSNDVISGSGTPPELGNELQPSTTEYSVLFGTDEIVYHRVTIDIHEPYREEYGQRNSILYKGLSENLTRAVDDLLEEIPGIQKSGVVLIQRTDDQFFSRVTLDISSEGYNNPERVKRSLQDQIERYNVIGQYNVLPNSFVFTDIGARLIPPPVVCGPGEIQCTTITGEPCVDNGARCNGTQECLDGRDEEGCPSTTTEPTTTPTTTTTTTTTTTPEVSIKPAFSFSPKQDSSRCRADDQVRCTDGSKYICENQKCDGVPDCPDGDDEEGCPSDDNDCTSDEFLCDIGRCIPQNEVCDGVQQCNDGADESNCPERACDRNREFECEDGTCLPLSRRCDGEYDCKGTGSDERNCPKKDSYTCAPDQFRCSSGNCINSYLMCDRRVDCPDGSDEDNCGSTCTRDQFRCNSGYCLPLSVVCNGQQDCPTGEDEHNCPSTPCPPSEYECRDRSGCYRDSQRCDSYPDCRDSSDEENCGPVCGSNEITCGDGSCVSKSVACDGVPNCNDAADEQNCPRQDLCAFGYFSCGDGSCIPQARRCDRRTDCRDGSDERNCTAPVVPPVSCSSSQFACHSGDQCVPISAHCNRIYECRDYSDESNCAGPPDGLNLKTYPPEQIIKESREVVFQCRDEGPLRASVKWSREGGLPLPPGSRDIKGRLEMPNIQIEHTGSYACEAIGFASSPGSRVTVYLKVEPFEQQLYPTKAACRFDEATCSNGECIAKYRVCDGHYDCEDRSDELRCNPHGCEPNEFRCDNKKCVQRTWMCDSDDDCGDGSDERNCKPSPPGSRCRYDEFQCTKVEQCIPKAFHCDLEIDCQDGTDETGCRKSEIIRPPPPMIIKQPGDSFTITCTALAVPTPEVLWRLNWGHIPSKCRTTSEDGLGTLTCPNVQESDQGAYSCEALNNQGPVFAVPDTILVVKANRTVCPQGTFNELATSYADCIPCFCFGITTSCRSADLFVYQLPPPVDVFRIVNVDIRPGGGLEIRGDSSKFQTQVQPIDRSGFQISLNDNDLKANYYSTVYPYFALPETYLGNQLKSYGGYIKYTVKSDGTSAPLPIPDVILTGNDLTLVYKGAPINSGAENNIGVRLFPGNWYKVSTGSRREYPASRQDLMMVLQQVDHLLIRTQYFSDGLETKISDISMDSAIHSNVGQGQAAYVEQCDCPVGYSGSSCESCSAGFMHQPGSWLGTCEGPVKCPPMHYKDPRDNTCKPCSCPHSYQFGTGCRLDYDSKITCDCPPGYEGRNCEKCSYPLYEGNPLLNQPCTRRRVPECDPAGSLSTEVDPYTGRCRCKEHATGSTCNQCKPNTFNLALENQNGCINCFCMGITNTCTSSDLYRTQIVSVFTRDNQGFKLAEANRLNDLITDIPVNPSAQEIYFQQFSSGVYYWVLPTKFLHNKVTSYGGVLKYTFRYMPTPGGQSSPNSAPDVEIVSDSGVHLVYYNRNQPTPEANRKVTVVVPLLEQYWERVDGEKPDREHFMIALADLVYILVKATYTTNTQEAALISVSLDTATTERNTGQSRAVEVELCQCPVGYRGTSCEECDAGYKRVDTRGDNDGYMKDMFLSSCEPCSCNGYSTECDPETGRCLNCKGYTKGESCEQCIDGFYGNVSAGIPCSPLSQGCSCDPRGSVSTYCDRNQQCSCKTNVVGLSCNECRQGTFDLSQDNLDGCIECYCSGVSKDCQSSNLYREAIPMQIIDDNHQFTLTDKSRNVIVRDGFLLNQRLNEIGYNFSNQLYQLLFWSLPPVFTGNKVLSYGGYLNFTKMYTSLPSSLPSHDTDVVIFSPTMKIFWIDEDNFSPDTRKVISIPLKENHWKRLDETQGMRLASRADMMKVLSNIQGILIRAQYSINTQASYLSDVSLDTAVYQRTPSQQVAAEVEVCRCPPGYKGTSCESCSTGYYQDYDSTCKKCPCNGNEEHCALGAQQQVICSCKSPYGGTYCDRIVNGDTPRPDTGSPTISISISEPTVIVIEAGREANFTCTGRSLRSSEPVRLEWSKDNGFLPVGRAYDNGQGLLVIRDVQDYDAGTYICTASDGYTFVTETAYLNVGGPAARPVVTVTPKSLDVYEGQPVKFRCEATGSPQPVLTWVQEGSNRLPPQSSLVNGVFEIPSASLQYQGPFTCIARNTAGEAFETVYLNVRNAIPTSPPQTYVQLSIKPDDYSGITGDIVRLECDVSNPKNVRLQWSRQDSAMSQNAKDLSDGKLIIYNSKSEDSGIYTCTAVDHNSGSVLQEARVRVNISPPQRPQPTININPPSPVPQGSEAELRCFTSDGQVQWSKAGGPLPSNAKVEGDVLLIKNIQVRDRGIYICEVNGPGGSSRAQSMVEVEQLELPSIELHPEETQTVVEGHSVMWQCRVVRGNPEPTVQWSRVDGAPLSQNMEQMPNGFGVLRSNSISRSDEGQYLCTATNKVGSARTVAVLKVVSEPVITITPPGQTVQVSAGQRVRLDCRATGYPQPTVFWSKHSTGNSFYNPKSLTAETVESSVYEINGASESDQGSYTCMARNTAGEKTEMLHLIISDDVTQGGQDGGYSPNTGAYAPKEDFVVLLGGNAYLSCKTQGPQQYLWERYDRRPLGPNYDQRDGNLTISNVQYVDGGEYVCKGLGPRGEEMFTTVFRVRVMEPSRLTLDPKHQVVRPGDNARITCTATGPPPRDIRWSSANRPTLPSSVRVSGGVLEFVRIQVSDEGQYICRAYYDQGTLDATAEVIVNDNRGSFGVTAVERNPKALEGSSVIMNCRSADYREITWRRENRPLPQRARIRGSSLEIENLQLEDAGRYICSTIVYGSTQAEDYINLIVELNPCTLDQYACRNRECIPLLQACDGIPHCRDGSDESTCQIRPGPYDVKLRIQPSKREIHYGDAVDLICSYTGPPDVKLYWSRPDGSNLSTNHIPGGEVLRIDTVTTENIGTYRCTAMLRNSRFDEKYSLTVHDDQLTHNYTSFETVTAEYGKSIELECKIDLEGTITYDWTKDGEVLPANLEKFGRYLTIPFATYKEAGLYVCTASNGNIQAQIPTIVVVQGAVPFFNQAPKSYLALPPLRSPSNVKSNIEITFKPENRNGLILYNGMQNGGSGDFISFGLREGEPEFRFDAGSGPGIIKATQPLTMGEWHTVQLSREKTQGTMVVDDSQIYYNKSTGAMVSLDLFLPLYLGGVPEFSVVNKQNGFNSGFVGCISRLVVNKEEMDIMKEQKDSEGVTSCETCAVNPCDNNGKCQEAPTRTGYTCLCPGGYTGPKCSPGGEPCYQGACGDGRCVQSEEGFECLCRLGKAGDRCERDVSITQPSFSKNSYLAYPTPKRVDKIKIYVTFNPADDSNGLLLYCAENEDGSGDFLAIYIKDRHVELAFSASTGITVLRSSNEVVPGRWATVDAGVSTQQATLSLTGESLPVSKDLQSAPLKFTTMLYVGGYDQQRIRPAPGMAVRQGLTGCVSEVYISNLNLDLIRSVLDSVNIQQCSARHDDPCDLRPCQNNGVCSRSPDGSSYQCSCPTGFSGVNCESEEDICVIQQPCRNGGVCVSTTPTSYKCNCPTGFTGYNCEERTKFEREVSFSGDGYVELSKSLMSHYNPEEQEVINIEFSTTEPDGLLLWHGQTPDTDGAGKDYLYLAVVNGHLQFSYELGSLSPAVIDSPSRVDDGKIHTAVIKRQAMLGTIELDGGDIEFGECGGLLTQLNTEGNIYIGGLPNLDLMTSSVDVHQGFDGCIHSLEIQTSGKINFAEEALSSVNTLPCTSSTSDDDGYDGGRGDTDA